MIEPLYQAYDPKRIALITMLRAGAFVAPPPGPR
jgi:hypothetical protein